MICSQCHQLLRGLSAELLHSRALRLATRQLQQGHPPTMLGEHKQWVSEIVSLFTDRKSQRERSERSMTRLTRYPLMGPLGGLAHISICHRHDQLGHTYPNILRVRHPYTKISSRSLQRNRYRTYTTHPLQTSSWWSTARIERKGKVYTTGASSYPRGALPYGVVPTVLLAVVSCRGDRVGRATTCRLRRFQKRT